MKNLSEDKASGVGKILSTISFMVIVYYFAGGQVDLIGTDKTLRLGLIPVHFTQPEKLINVILLMYVWFICRYFQLGAVRDYYENVTRDAHHCLMYENKKILLQKILEKSPDNINKFSYKTITALKIEDGFLAGESRSTIPRQHLKVRFPDKQYLFMLKSTFHYGSFVTFIFPIILSVFAVWIIFKHYL